MKTVTVALKEKSYPIYVGEGIIQNLDSLIKKRIDGDSTFIISNKNIFYRYREKLLSAFKKLKIKFRVSLVADTEESKSLATATAQLENLAKFSKGKRVFITAFGGGVIGDLAGFVASVYKRGIPYLQIPTTFLAQIDSSIGGKTGLDLKTGKNLVGTFYQPKLVISDIDFLKSLDNRQFNNGIAELVKYTLIKDAIMFKYLEKRYKAILQREKKTLIFVISRCAKIKAEIVSQDEREEKGLRTILNFGHTIGHALEAAGEYHKINHGEAIAIGMRAACKISVDLKLLDKAKEDRIGAMLNRFNLPQKIEGIPLNKIIRYLFWDKKFIGNKKRMVLLSDIGKPRIIQDVPLELIKKAIRELY